jgi:GAF domain-containing protein
LVCRSERIESEKSEAQFVSGQECELTVPMTGRDGSVLGVFQVINKQGGNFTGEDVDILSSVAISAAAAVESALS